MWVMRIVYAAILYGFAVGAWKYVLKPWIERRRANKDFDEDYRKFRNLDRKR